MQTVHATVVAFGSKGVLLRGPSGSGKSDLALRLIDAGAILVGDDRVELVKRHNSIVARCPEAIAGKLEVRGLGIVTQPYCPEVPVTLVVDLADAEDVERMPEHNAVDVLGCDIAWIRLAPFEASASVKIQLAVRHSPQEVEA